MPKISWKEIKVDKLIGSGTFGKVYEGKWNGNTVAIKQLFLRHYPTERFRRGVLSSLQTEISTTRATSGRVHRRRALCDGFGVPFQRIALQSTA